MIGAVRKDKKMTRESIIKNLQTADCFYVPFSVSTRMPYVMCDPIDFDDQILVFEREEDLKAYVGISMESVSTRSCTKKEMRNEKLS